MCEDGASLGAAMAGKAKRPGYDELAGQVAILREQVRALKAEVHRLRVENARLRGEAPEAVDETAEAGVEAAPRGRTSPPRWAKANVVRVSVRRPRKPRAPVPGRRREVPDRRVVHALDRCPHCATVLRRGRVVGRRQIIDLPVAAVEVVEHVVLERRCPGCGACCRGALPDLSDQAGAHRRVSWPVAALVAVLRTKLRLPIAQVQWLLAQLWGLRLSVGEVCGLLAEAARAARPAYEGLLAEARASPVVHLDETGWREDGRTGWVWTLTTPTVRLFRFSTSRAGTVARALLGPEAEGVLVSDFSTAYDQLDGRHQRCWAHLLRDIHDLTEQHPADAGLHAWAEGMHAIFTQAVAWTAAAGACPVAERERARLRFEAAVLALCRAQPAGAPHAALCQRVERYHPELFTFVADPAVPPTNNAAERALRPLVVGRKISGGSRSSQGSRTRMILQSVIATWEVRGLDPLAEMLTLLRAPRTPLLELASV
jgi:transposase